MRSSVLFLCACAHGGRAGGECESGAVCSGSVVALRGEGGAVVEGEGGGEGGAVTVHVGEGDVCDVSAS